MEKNLSKDTEVEIEELYRCCLCGHIYSGYGNNPEGAVALNRLNQVELLEFDDDDRCCDDCNSRFVIPGRLYRMYYNKK